MTDRTFFNSPESRIMCLTHDHPNLSHLDQAKLLFEQGAKLIQLRSKRIDLSNFNHEAIKIGELAKLFSAKVIINDLADLANRSSSWGVHLGMNDECPNQVRAKFGNNLIIGRTVHSLADAQKCRAENPDYIGIGPYRKSLTKNDLIPKLSLGQIKEIITAIHPIPTYLIGGLNEDDLYLIEDLKLTGLAICSALWKGTELTKSIRRIINFSKFHPA